MSYFNGIIFTPLEIIVIIFLIVIILAIILAIILGCNPIPHLEKKSKQKRRGSMKLTTPLYWGGVVTLGFFVLRLLGYLDWTWGWVFTPLILVVGIYLILLVVLLVGVTMITKLIGRQK